MNAMKPERIQISKLLERMNWGIFHLFLFNSPKQAKSFANFMFEMADNHGHLIAIDFDETHTRTKMLIAADPKDEVAVAAARRFSDTADSIYEAWSSPDAELPTEIAD